MFNKTTHIQAVSTVAATSEKLYSKSELCQSAVECASMGNAGTVN